MRVIRRISAVAIGLVFFVAGLLKLMDPVGAGLVVDEYLRFFHLGFLHFASGFLGSAMALLETITGAALITGVWRRYTAMVTIALLGTFTILTAILLIFNPKMDCGCFGQALPLTHMQSFLKNVALDALWVLAFIPFRKLEPTRKVKFVSFSITAVSVCLFLLYSSLSIPMMDFTDMKPGAELMPADDLAFGQDAPVLSFSDAEGQYADSLALGGKVLAVSAYDPAKVSEREWGKIASAMQTASSLGYTPLVLVASFADEMEAIAGAEDVLPYVYFADRKPLLTLNRSNGGASFIADGQVIAKWSVRKLPDEGKLATLAETDTTESLIAENNAPRLRLQGFLLYVFAVMLLL